MGGSLVVNYELEAEEGEDAATALAELEAKQTAMFSSGAIDLGAPMLEFTALVVSSDDGSSEEYEPVTF